MSALTFAGSPQFAALSMQADGASLAVVAAIVGCISSRFALMSFAASSVFEGGWVRRAILAQLVVDESWAIAYRPDRGAFDRARLIGSALVLYATHVGGTLLGACAAAALEPSRWGLDAALPALFAVLIWPYLRHGRARVIAVASAGLTLSLTPILPPGVPILAGASVAFFRFQR
jgi:predicted branched-subunit amino acid permease